MNNKFLKFTKQKPYAVANIKGSDSFPSIGGNVYFYQENCGVMTVAEVWGLPTVSGKCSSLVFAFHIHSGASCTGNMQDNFADAMTHYNPHNCPHPYHAGDMPPLFGAGDYAFLAFLTNRFTAEEIIGKTVIIHSAPDDFTTQPSGNSGIKIACGEIKRA